LPYNIFGNKVRPRIKIKNPMNISEYRKFPSSRKEILSLASIKFRINMTN